MGKKRITQLLNQLQTNHESELKNAAAVFTVAQVAVNQLEEQRVAEQGEIAALPPIALSKDDLKRCYGSYKACRAAAREKGIHFKKTPTWEQLGEAFSYCETFQALIRNYLSQHPSSKLSELSMTFNIHELG